MRGLLAAAWRHGLLEEPPRDRTVTPLTLYYCGQAFEMPAAPKPTTRLYAGGGFAFLRPASSRPAAAIEVAIHADARPEARAHGDAGRGSFEVRCGGAVFIREPGSYLQAGDPQSDYSRGAAAQNPFSSTDSARCWRGTCDIARHGTTAVLDRGSGFPTGCAFARMPSSAYSAAFA